MATGRLMPSCSVHGSRFLELDCMPRRTPILPDAFIEQEQRKRNIHNGTLNIHTTPSLAVSCRRLYDLDTPVQC